MSETCEKKVPFRCFCFGKGFLSLLVGNLDDPKVLARYLILMVGKPSFDFLEVPLKILAISKCT